MSVPEFEWKRRAQAMSAKTFKATVVREGSMCLIPLT
jgi:hypothetical protein